METENNTTEGPPFAGQKQCGKNKCKIKAFWKSGPLYLCGYHSRKDKERVHLPPMDEVTKHKKQKARMAEERYKVEEAAAANKTASLRGNVILSDSPKKEGVRKEGYVSVYTNPRHQKLDDGIYLKDLNPSNLGPVEHGQPGLPTSRNLENFYQGSKCYPEEIGEDGNPSLEYYINRLDFYNDPVPHKSKTLVFGDKIGKKRGHKDLPYDESLFFIWVDLQGLEHRLNDIERRELYCIFYESLVLKQEDMCLLNWMLEEGYNIQLFTLGKTESAKTWMEDLYLDGSFPFGYEHALFCMLTMENPEDYPWRKHKSGEKKFICF